MTHQQPNYALKKYIPNVIGKQLPSSVNNAFFDTDIRFWKDSLHCSILGRKSKQPISIFFQNVNSLSNRQLYPVQHILMKVVDCCWGGGEKKQYSLNKNLTEVRMYDTVPHVTPH